MSRRTGRTWRAGQLRDVAALELDAAALRRRPGAAASGRWSTCRSPIRRPAPAFRRRARSKLTCSTAWTRRVDAAEEAGLAGRSASSSPRTLSSGVACRASARRPGQALGLPRLHRRERAGISADASVPCIDPSRGTAESSARVYGCTRRREDLLDRALLDLLAAPHHEHAVGDLGDDAHVVGDEHHRHPHLVLQQSDQRQDLRLDRDVERGGRLVGDQQARAARQRHRDHHPLAHAARELMRIARQHLRRFRDAHQLEHAQRLGVARQRGPCPDAAGSIRRSARRP